MRWNGCSLLLLAVVARTSFAAGSSVAPPVTADVVARIDSIAAESLKDGVTPGIALAVVRDGAVVLAKGYGVADIQTQQPVTSNTLFAAGSTTKSVTALALMRLVDEGQVELDAYVTKYVPYFRVADARFNKITVRHLLTMSSGLPHEWFPLADKQDPHGLEKRVRALATRKLLFAPGTGYQYSNSNYAVIGQIIERVSGEAFHAFVTRHVLEPLCMKSSSVDAVVATEGLATGYVRGTRVAHIARMPRLYREWNPAGNLVTSAVDAGRYVAFQLGDGHADCGGLVLSTAAMNEMHRGQVPGDGVLEAIGLHGMRYAFGWETNDFEGLQLVSHGGDMDSHAAFFLFIPRAGIGVALLMNTLDYGKLQVPINVARLLLGLEVSPYQSAPAATAVPATAFKGDPAVWRSLVGRYDTSDGPMRVFVADGSLHAEVMAGRGWGEVLRLEPSAPAEFIARSGLLRWEGRKLLFKVGTEGVCASLDGESYGSRVDPARTTDACR